MFRGRLVFPDCWVGGVEEIRSIDSGVFAGVRCCDMGIWVSVMMFKRQ